MNMILIVDIGNTNIVVGGIDKDKIYFIERLSTNRTKTELEYAIDFKSLMDIHKISPAQFEGGIISSVVPQITGIVRVAAEKILKKKVQILSPGTKTGLNIKIDNPAQLGSDLVADAVAGVNLYPVPQIIIDIGTATTFCVLDSNRNYVGGLILPGPQISLDALTARASQLSGISMEAPKHVIGKNTLDCMKSGIVNGNASTMDGLIERIEEELGEQATVLATGGLAKCIIPYCKRKIILDDELLLKGLYIIYQKNI